MGWSCGRSSFTGRLAERTGGVRRLLTRPRLLLLLVAVVLLLSVGSTTPAGAAPASRPSSTARSPEVMAELFRRVADGREGCAVLMDAETGAVLFEAGAARCSKRFSPCSTFKLPLALMAFDQGVVTLDSQFKWDGKTRVYASWNRHQTTVTWMRESVVWVSQQIAHRLGRPTMDRYLGRFAYGNRDISGGLDRAWLGESLEISALEQVRFLARLWTGKLPLHAGVAGQVEGLLLRDEYPSGAVLLGKTGSGLRCLRDASGRPLQDRQLGWFVGCVKKNGRTVVFAMNITDLQIREPAGRVTRGVVKRLLVELGFL